MIKRIAKRKSNGSKSSNNNNSKIRTTFRSKCSNYKEKVRKLNPGIFRFGINDSFIFQLFYI